MPENSVKTENFEAFLVDNGFITKTLFDNLKEQSQQSHQPILSLIVSKNILNDEALAKARAAFLNIPYVSFADRKVPQEVINLIPDDTYTFYKLFAFEHEGQNLKVAMVDPTNIQGLEALEFISKNKGFNIQLYVTDQKSYDEVINKQHGVTRVVGKALADIKETEKAEEKHAAETPLALQASLQDMVQDAPISKIVDVILTNAIDGNASDVHIEPSDKELRVRYRVDGILHVALVLPLDVLSAIVSKIKILSNLKIDEQRLPQDGRFHYQTPSRQVDLRVSILPNVNGEKIVMRILDKDIKVPTLEDLGFHGRALRWIMENIKKTHGIFLVTGPTGSGKSTTLYSLLSILNTTAVNIITLEDPVEYYIEGVNQTQINPDIGLTFAAGLRSILRQDPNIIMVGEIRDKETAELAVHAALTGHLVFSTLHTNDAVGALPRLIDMNIEPFLLVASINAVAAQRLTRKICPDCKKEVELTKAIRDEFKKVLAGADAEELAGVDLEDMKIFKGEGCAKCNHTGYRGRIAIVEVLPLAPNIQQMVLDKVKNEEILAAAQKLGMITMQQDGVLKVLQGITTYEEVVRVTSE